MTRFNLHFMRFTFSSEQGSQRCHSHKAEIFNQINTWKRSLGKMPVPEKKTTQKNKHFQSMASLRAASQQPPLSARAAALSAPLPGSFASQVGLFSSFFTFVRQQRQINTAGFIFHKEKKKHPTPSTWPQQARCLLAFQDSLKYRVLSYCFSQKPTNWVGRGGGVDGSDLKHTFIHRHSLQTQSRQLCTRSLPIEQAVHSYIQLRA